MCIKPTPLKLSKYSLKFLKNTRFLGKKGHFNPSNCLCSPSISPRQKRASVLYFFWLLPLFIICQLANGFDYIPSHRCCDKFWRLYHFYDRRLFFYITPKQTDFKDLKGQGLSIICVSYSR